MNYLIRELRQDEIKVLDTFLYEAIYIPEGVTPPAKDIMIMDILIMKHHHLRFHFLKNIEIMVSELI